ncbi:Glucose-6-phosphate isomerase [Giardia muris]|uniref:Glucose-6-phosphate isomerase n=1 Tax=Giardia muris TaxID=5742 RepID=A0A4Z1T2H0_GIAMU|nr:Glucose-6-phosphate isomerase [Giardia muris]|eukprot:TNJ26611.1 Glucose-6-phosphate isomerase [Giardia muris]
MQAKHFHGYRLYDEKTRFGFEFAGFRGFNVRKQGEIYKQAHAAAFSLIDKIERMEVVNTTAHPTEAENRAVDHFNLRKKEEVKGCSLAKSLEQWQAISTFAQDVSKDFDHVIYNGIGGSYLGPFLLLTAKYGDDYNMALTKRGLPTAHFVANTDSTSFSQLVTLLTGCPDGDVTKDKAAASKVLGRTLMVVISKSGGTAETATNCASFINLFKTLGIDHRKNLAVVTVAGSKLDKQAHDEGFRGVFHMNETTGGRTSVCSAVGMVPAAFARIDFAQFLQGMSDMDELTRGSRADPMKNPAMAYATLLDWLLKDRSTPFNLILLAYSDPLKHLAHYCQQLFMESLGKNYGRTALPLRTGLSIYGGTGTAEQHAFMQQIQKGVSDSAVQIVRIRSRPADYTDAGAGSMGRQLLAFVKGTEMALYQNERPFLTLAIENTSEYSVGQLIAFEERAIAILSAFWEMNAFDQPGVQDGKLACLTCNALSKAIEKGLADLISQKKSVSGPADAILKAIGVSSMASVVGALDTEEKEDITAWMADSILEDIVTNHDVPGSYSSICGKLAASKSWNGSAFVYSFGEKK